MLRRIWYLYPRSAATACLDSSPCKGSVIGRIILTGPVRIQGPPGIPQALSLLAGRAESPHRRSYRRDGMPAYLSRIPANAGAVRPKPVGMSEVAVVGSHRDGATAAPRGRVFARSRVCAPLERWVQFAHHEAALGPTDHHRSTLPDARRGTRSCVRLRVFVSEPAQSVPGGLRHPA